MSEKDEKDLDIPNFGGVDITEEDNVKEQNTPLKVDKKAKAKAELEAKNKADKEAKAKQKAETQAETDEEAKETVPKKETAAKTKEKVNKDDEKKQSNEKDNKIMKSNPTKKADTAKKEKYEKSSPSKAVQPKGKRKPNYLVIATLIVIAIPCLVLLYIIIGSHETKGEPVVGDRFEDALDPAITETELSGIKSALQFDQAENVVVNLKSATLRITIDTNNNLSQDEIEAIMNDAFDIVTQKLPMNTYFTNKKNGDTTVKMYDLEVDVYNFIAENEEDKENQIHVSRTKNAAAESDNVDILSTPKNAETSDEILNPDLTTPPTEEQNAEGE